MEAAFLVRCSTDRQDYQRQLDDLHLEASRFDFNVQEKNIFGEHITGRDDATKGDRLSIKKLRKAVENNDFDVILISEVSRLSRDSLSGRYYIRLFNNSKMPIYFRDKGRWTIDIATGVIDTAFEKELGLYFDGASEYLKSMKTQVTSGRRKRTSENQMVQGQPAFGYVRKGGYDKRTKSTLIINPDTSKIVIDVYKKYLEEGSTLKSTAIFVSDKYQQKFSVSKVYHMLTYAGYHSGKSTVTIKDPDRPDSPPNVYTITFEPFIDEDDYIAVRKRLDNNRNTVNTHYARQQVQLLSRLIKCSFCGHSFTPKKRQDGRPAYSWVCMSRINNKADCDSYINLNNDKTASIVWSLLKKELITFSELSREQREEKIKVEESHIVDYNQERESLEREKKKYDKINERAYEAYLSAPESIADSAKDNYHRTLEKTNKDINYAIDRISLIDQNIKDCRARIYRYEHTDYTDRLISEIESDFTKQRDIIKEYIKAIYPYKVAYRVAVLEMHTIDGIYSILLDANQKNHKVAYYIHNTYGIWQNSNSRLRAYESGDYFVVSNASMIMDTDSVDECLTYEEMAKVCSANDWTIPY